MISLRPRSILLLLAGWWVLTSVGLAAEPAAAPPKLTLGDGDRVVLLGSTFIEREQTYGYFEAGLISRFPGQKILVRNLGWSGDTVWGEARAGFGSPADGFNQLVRQVQSVQPTVIIVAYGNNEAFAGPAGVPRFVAGLNTLLDALATTKARIVVLSPLEQENLGPPLADPAQYNQSVKLYSNAIAAAADERGLLFANILRAVSYAENPSALRVTDNGMHLTASGYWRSTAKILAAVGLPATPWLVDLEGTKVLASSRANISAIERTANGLKFRVKDEWLTETKAPEGTSELALANRAANRTLRIRGLNGRHTLRIDGREIDTFTSDDWSQGIVGIDAPDADQAEKLRRQIVAKNELYFHRWRPQNETYLLGFRKGEQGKNAVEIPQFDPMVASKDERIRQLTIPAEHVYELIEQ